MVLTPANRRTTMTETTTSSPPTGARKPRRMAREPGRASQQNPAAPAAPAERQPGKLDRVEALLRREAGASIAEMVEATGWQQHTVRGAMAGALKKRGLAIVSDKADGVRRYRIEAQ
jgi:hypothetical protein